MLALCLKLSPDEAVVWRWPLQLIPKQFPLSSVIGDTWEQILELVSSPTAEVSTSARVGCTRMLGQGYADKQYTEGSTLQASRTCPRDVPCWRREGCRMKISALEVVGKFTGVSSHGVIVMKRWVHGSWCRGTKGLLEHMATVANYPQPLQNLHFLEVQWMWVARPWVLESVGGSSVRTILQKINTSLVKFVLSDPLATHLTVLSCRESSESHLSSSGSFALHCGSKDLVKVFLWGPTFSGSSSPGMATPKAKEGSPKVTSEEHCQEGQSLLPQEPGRALMYLHLINGQHC